MSEHRRLLNRNARMTQPIRLTMGEMSILREALLPKRDGLMAAVEPFGMLTTWDALNRLDGVIDKVIEARCALKRRQHSDYNPAGDSECEGYATDAEINAWAEAHPPKDAE